MAITETSQKLVNEDFKTNISIEGYSTFSTPTNTNKGGTTIYVNNSFDITERLDLNVTHNQSNLKIKRVRIYFVDPQLFNTLIIFLSIWKQF